VTSPCSTVPIVETSRTRCEGLKSGYSSCGPKLASMSGTMIRSLMIAASWSPSAWTAVAASSYIVSPSERAPASELSERWDPCASHCIAIPIP
jgi:hypothetical protein